MMTWPKHPPTHTLTLTLHTSVIGFSYGLSDWGLLSDKDNKEGDIFLTYKYLYSAMVCACVIKWKKTTVHDISAKLKGLTEH